jgi:hypothetical protein
MERWDGGILTGRLDLEFVSVQVGGRPCQVPPGDLLEVELSPPALDSGTLSRIKDLVSRLSSADWATRESATRELGAFGYLASSVLRRELAETDDPEVARRLERVLSGLN